MDDAIVGRGNLCGKVVVPFDDLKRFQIQEAFVLSLLPRLVNTPFIVDGSCWRISFVVVVVIDLVGLQIRIMSLGCFKDNKIDHTKVWGGML